MVACTVGLFLSLTLLLSGADAACPTCVGPTFHWDTIPAFFHSSEHVSRANDGGFNEEALDLITKFPMVTIEKWQGDQVKPPIFQEQAWVVAAKQIKARNSNITVVVWLDSFRIYTADKLLNPDILTPCTTGHFQPARFLETGGKMGSTGDPGSVYLLKNKSGLPALEAWSHCHMFDHTQQVARDYWTEMCLNLTRTGVIDGCGADASWQNGVDQAQAWGLDAATAEAWSEGHKQMMRNTTAQLGQGVLLGKDPWELGDYVNGVLHEGCDATEATILTLQNLTAISRRTGRRLIYQCHGVCVNTSQLAAFLIGAGTQHYFGCGPWNGQSFEDHRPAVLDKPLGPPKSDGRLAGGKWEREFASAHVKFDPSTNEGSIEFLSRNQRHRGDAIS